MSLWLKNQTALKLALNVCPFCVLKPQQAPLQWHLIQTDPPLPCAFSPFFTFTLNLTWSCKWALSALRKRQRPTDKLAGSHCIIKGQNPSTNWFSFWSRQPLNKSPTPSGNGTALTTLITHQCGDRAQVRGRERARDGIKEEMTAWWGKDPVYRG